MDIRGQMRQLAQDPLSLELAGKSLEVFYQTKKLMGMTEGQLAVVVALMLAQVLKNADAIASRPEMNNEDIRDKNIVKGLLLELAQLGKL